MEKKIICPNCGRKYAGIKNEFGKLCMKCGYEIPPSDELECSIITDNKIRKERLLKILRSML